MNHSLPEPSGLVANATKSAYARLQKIQKYIPNFTVIGPSKLDAENRFMVTCDSGVCQKGTYAAIKRAAQACSYFAAYLQCDGVCQGPVVIHLKGNLCQIP
jgi:hypothetical protein